MWIKLNKEFIYIIFMIFNVILGFSGLAVIGGGIYLIIKIEFNQYIIIVIGLGLIIAAIVVIGFFTKKRANALIIYMILISIIFVLELALALVIKFHEETNLFIKDSIKEIIDVNEEKKDEIINVSVYIISTASACSALSCIFAFIYYKKLKGKSSSKYLDDNKNGDEFMKGLDYTNLNIDTSGI